MVVVVVMVGNRRVEGTRDRRSQQDEVLSVRVPWRVLGTAQGWSTASQVVSGMVCRVPAGQRDRLLRFRGSEGPSTSSQVVPGRKDFFLMSGRSIGLYVVCFSRVGMGRVIFGGVLVRSVSGIIVVVAGEAVFLRGGSFGLACGHFSVDLGFVGSGEFQNLVTV